MIPTSPSEKITAPIEEIPEIEPEDVEYPEEAVEKPHSEISIEERERREKNLETFLAAQKADALFFREPSELATQTIEVSRNNIATFIEGVQRAEDRVMRYRALAKSQETSQLEITDKKEKGRNGISRRTYEGPPPMTAYVKPQSSEANFWVDPEDGIVYEMFLVWNEKEQRLEPKKRQAPEDLQGLDQKYNQRDSFLESFAIRYDVPIDELPYSLDTLTFRLGIESGSAPMHEWAASRINDMIQWDIVPLTVLRQERAGDDIMSVQEAVPATDPKIPPRPLDEKTLVDMIELGPKHPAAASFMQIACFDYLTNSTDRIPGNIIYDEVAQKCYAIDNTNSMGLTLDIGAGTFLPDLVVSVPYEVILEHDDWTLDDEAVRGLRFLAEGVNQYLKGESKPGDLRYQQLQETFHVLFPHKKIADIELQLFAERLNHLVTHRRPPHVQKAYDLVPGYLLRTVDGLIQETRQRKPAAA